MALASKTSSPVVSSGEIKFSKLREQFKTIIPRADYDDSSDNTSGDSNSISIKASELLRTTDTTSTDPIVPDSTENQNISNDSNWKTSQFRNSVKYYFIKQSGTTDNSSDNTSEAIDIANLSWNNNLNKTIRKFLFIEGTVGSVNPDKASIKLESLVYNLNIKISGSVLGASGLGGGTPGRTDILTGGNGGDAFLLNPSSGSSNLIINLIGSGVIKSGGGGGGKGGLGGSGGEGGIYYLHVNPSGTGCYMDNAYGRAGGAGGAGGPGSNGQGYLYQSIPDTTVPGVATGTAGSAGTAGISENKYGRNSGPGGTGAAGGSGGIGGIYGQSGGKGEKNPANGGDGTGGGREGLNGCPTPTPGTAQDGSEPWSGKPGGPSQEGDLGGSPGYAIRTNNTSSYTINGKEVDNFKGEEG